MRGLITRLMAQDSFRESWTGRLLRQAYLRYARFRGTGFIAGEFVEYPDWIARDTLGADQLNADRASWAGRPGAPLISVLMPAFNPRPEDLKEAIDSILAQSYPNWELVIVDDGSQQALDEHLPDGQAMQIRLIASGSNSGIGRATQKAAEAARGDIFVFFDQDDRLAPWALSALADAMLAYPSAQVFYSDEDKLDGRGARCEPYFKPGFSRALLYSHNYINHLCAIRAAAFTDIGGMSDGFDGSQDFALLLAVLERFGREAFHHMPGIAYHWRKGRASGSFSETHGDAAWAAGAAALREHFDRSSDPSPATIEPGFGQGRRLVFPAPDYDEISVIIPTRDRHELLSGAVAAVRSESQAIEIIIVDNGSSDPETLAWLSAFEKADGVCQVLREPGAFNYSRLVNIGAAAAQGSMLVLMNNDVASGNEGWIRELAGWASFEWAGAVGARLDYPDGSLQHGGILLGPGGHAGHFGRGFSADAAGPFGHLKVARGCSAVTAACLAVKRSVYESVGGFDEEAFPVAFSDVDLCLRIAEQGLENVWTPHARLVHLEGASRGREAYGDDPEFDAAVARLKMRWDSEVSDDAHAIAAFDNSSEAVRLSWDGRLQPGLFERLKRPASNARQGRAEDAL